MATGQYYNMKIFGLYGVECHKVENGQVRWVLGGFGGSCGSVWVMGE